MAVSSLGAVSQSLESPALALQRLKEEDKLSTGGLSSTSLSTGGVSTGNMSNGGLSNGLSIGGLSSVGSVSSAATVAALSPSNGTTSSRGADPHDDSALGPLPPLWEKATTDNHEVYFIDHNTGTSHWLDPRLSRFRKKSLAECREDELPFGWERIECPRYGAYFIDHVNRRTQYENPVLQARRNAREMGSVEREVDGEAMALRSMLSRDPKQLTGRRFTVTLVKSSQGLGFTLVGGASESADDAESSQSTTDCCEDFLQIKSIVPNSPAWGDGALRTGDLLVRVGNTCVLGTGHAKVARLFQEIPPGTAVTLELCRGYPLPFDHNDPNRRVLTTVAVEAGAANTQMRHLTNELRERFSLEEVDKRSQGSSLERGSRSINMSMNRSYDREHLDDEHEDMERDTHLNRSFELEQRMSVLNRSLELDRLTTSRSSAANRSYDLDSRPDVRLSDRLPARCPSADHLLMDSTSSAYLQEGGVLTLRLMKGAAGFGFTIADSVHGQKVKKVLDRVRCGGLREGDLLISINQTSVSNMSHAHVVQVLKDCPQKMEATIKVVRRPGYLTNKAVPPVQSKPAPSSAKSRLTKDITSLFRSKTPTADLYSTQQKEVLPSRPKTPLVDTRNMTSTDNYINLGVGYSQEDLTSPQQISPNSSSSYKFIKKRRNSSNLAPNPQTSASSSQINNNQQMTASNGSIGNSQHYRSSGVGATVDNRLSKNPDAANSSYSADLNDNGVPLVQTVPLNESNMAAAYGGTSSSNLSHGHNQANSITGDSSDNGGFPVFGSRVAGVGLVSTADSSGRDSAAGCFSCYSPRAADSPLTRNHHPPITNLPVQRHNYDEVSPIAVDWSTVPPNHQSEEIVDPCADLVVVLGRGAAGFGFRIVGGTEEGSQVAVGHIVPGGSCDLDGRICPGDLITSVDGVSSLGASHRSAVASVCRAAANGQVTLGIKKSRNNNSRLGSSSGNVLSVQAGLQGYLHNPQQTHILMDNPNPMHYNQNSSANQYYNTSYHDGNYALNGGPTPTHDRMPSSHTLNYELPDTASPYPAYYSQNGSAYRVPTTSYMKNQAHMAYGGQPHANANYGDNDMHDLTGQYSNMTLGSTPYDVVVQRSENEGFGFVIISSTNKATSTIGQLIAGSPAARCGVLHVGDTILAINHTPIRHLSHGDIVNLIKHSGYSVTLTIHPSPH